MSALFGLKRLNMFKSIDNNIFNFLVSATITLTLFIPSESLSKTCCQRNVGTKILFPYDRDSKVYNDMGYIGTESGWDEVFVSFEHCGGPYL